MLRRAPAALAVTPRDHEFRPWRSQTNTNILRHSGAYTRFLLSLAGVPNGCMTVGYLLFLQEQIKGIIIIDPLDVKTVEPHTHLAPRHSVSSRTTSMLLWRTRFTVLVIDDDVFYLFLQKQHLAQRYIPRAYLSQFGVERSFMK